MTLTAKPYLQKISLNPEMDINVNQFPFTIPAIREVGTITFHPDVTFFIGENGAGKSTILEAIAVGMGFGQEGGTRNVQAKTTDTISSLHTFLKLTRSFRKPKDSYFFRAESFFNIATYMDEVGYLVGYGGQSLHACSHGEAFMALLLHKFKGNGLYILDEPEAALSPNRQLSALAAIHQLVNDDSQFIIATHSPILLAYPNAKILQFDDSGIQEIAFEDTDHYVITRDFLNNHEKRLSHLLSDD